MIVVETGNTFVVSSCSYSVATKGTICIPPSFVWDYHTYFRTQWLYLLVPCHYFCCLSVIYHYLLILKLQTL